MLSKGPFLVLLMALACLLTASAGGSTISWKSGASGNWSVAANWHPAQVPGPSDTAVINAKGTYTVTLDTNASVSGLDLGANDGNTQTLELNAKTFTLAGQAVITNGGFIDLSSGTFFGETNTSGAVINGTLTCTGSTLSGVLTLASNSVINLYGPSDVFYGLVAFTNYGTINWSNTDLSDNDPAQIYNYGLWDAQSDNTFNSAYPSSFFSNYGTVRKDGSSHGLTTFNTTFENSDTLDAEAGSIILTTGNGSGFFNTATNAGISLGNFSLTGDATFTGPGIVQGAVSGYNGVIHGTMTFDYGSFAGTLTVASNSIVNLVGIRGETTPIGFYLLNFTNYGTVIWSNLDINCRTGPQINNYGLWVAATNNTFYGNVGGGSSYISVFNNYGIFRKAGGAFSGGGNDYTALDGNTAFNNYGTVDNELGLLLIYTGNSSNGSMINTVSNAYTSLGITLSGDVIFTGSGDINSYLNGSNAVIHGIVTTTFITLTGTLTLATNGVFNFSPLISQPISFDGTTFTNYGTVLWTSNDLYGQDSPQIYNYGLWNAQFDNTFHGADSWFTGPASGTTTFNNYGTFRKSGGNLSISQTYFDVNTTVNNLGTMDNEVGLLEIEYGNGDRGSVINTVSNANTDFDSSYALFGDVYLTGAGAIYGNLNGSNGVIHGVVSTTSMLFMGGTLTLASNSVMWLTGPIFFQGTTFTNDGTVIWTNSDNGQSNNFLYGISSPQIFNYGLWDAAADSTFFGGYGGGTTIFNNHGTFRKSGGNPLAFPSQTALDGNTVFNNSGLTDIQIGNLGLDGSYSLAGGTLNFGISSPTDFGEILFENNASLAGSLSVNLNNYSPAAGDSFPLLIYTSETGTFTSVDLPHLPPALTWQTDDTADGGTAFLLGIVSASPLQLSAGLNVGGHSISFSWSGLSGQTYQVQCTTNLAPADWVDLGSSIPGTNGTITVTDPIGAAQKFYRIEVQ